MNSKIQSQGFLNKILSDQKLQQEWQKYYKNKQLNSSGQDTGNEMEIQHKMQQKIKNIASKARKKIQKSKTLQQFQLVSQKLKSRTIQLEQYKKQAFDVVQQNYQYKRNLLDINASIKDLYFLIANKFSKYFDKPMTDLEQLNDNAVAIVKQIRKKLSSISNYQAQTKQGCCGHKQKLQKSTQQLANLTKINQRLLAYIQQRKIYTESLKQKIASLKQQNLALQGKNNNETKAIINIPNGKTNSNSISKTKQSKSQISKFEQKVDIKYMHRNDLIVLMRNLIQKIIAHDKVCKNTEIQKRISLKDLQRISTQSITRRSKSRQRSKQKSNR